MQPSFISEIPKVVSDNPFVFNADAKEFVPVSDKKLIESMPTKTIVEGKTRKKVDFLTRVLEFMTELKIHNVVHLKSEINRLERLSGIDVRAFLAFGSTDKSVFYLKS